MRDFTWPNGLKNYLGTAVAKTAPWFQIRTVQKLLGHQDIKTTRTFTHVLNRGGKGVKSPVDDLSRGERWRSYTATIYRPAHGLAGALMACNDKVCVD